MPEATSRRLANRTGSQRLLPANCVVVVALLNLPLKRQKRALETDGSFRKDLWVLDIVRLWKVADISEFTSVVINFRVHSSSIVLRDS
jgi:hypothetical protein